MIALILAIIVMGFVGLVCLHEVAVQLRARRDREDSDAHWTLAKDDRRA